MTKRLKEEMNMVANAQAVANAASIVAQVQALPGSPEEQQDQMTPQKISITPTTSSTNNVDGPSPPTLQQATICLPQGVTIHVSF
jgi:hypothetical protein